MNKHKSKRSDLGRHKQRKEPKPAVKPEPQQKQKYRPEAGSGYAQRFCRQGGGVKFTWRFKAQLESVAQFDLVITASYKPIIVLKHAVDYVELAELSSTSTSKT